MIVGFLPTPRFSPSTLCTLSSNPPDQVLRKGFTGRTQHWFGDWAPDLDAVTKSLLLPGRDADTLRDRPYEALKRGLAKRVGSPAPRLKRKTGVSERVCRVDKAESHQLLFLFISKKRGNAWVRILSERSLRLIGSAEY